MKLLNNPKFKYGDLVKFSREMAPTNAEFYSFTHLEMIDFVETCDGTFRYTLKVPDTTHILSNIAEKSLVLFHRENY